MTQQAGFTPPPMQAPVGGGGNFEKYLPDEKPHAARLVWLILTGTVKSVYKGEDKEAKKIIFGFELPSTLLPESHSRKGEPAFISETHNYFMSENANMRKFIQQWRGEDFTDEEAKVFDISKMLGAPAVVDIIHKSDKKDPKIIYANIESIKSVKKHAKMLAEHGIKFDVPPQVNPTIYFNVDWLNMDKQTAEYGMVQFATIPDYYQKKIMESPEWKAYTTQPWYIAPVLKESSTTATTPPATPQVAPTANQQFPAQPQVQADPIEMPPAQEFGDGSPEDDSDLPF